MIQLKFFANIFNDSELEKYECKPIINILAVADCFDTNTFSFLYNRLQNNLLIETSKLTDPVEQIKYINIIDYLTDPDERAQLLSNIEWSNIFWVKLFVNNFNNLDKFFNKKELYHGYKSSLLYMNSINKVTDKQICELGNFFTLDRQVKADDLLKVIITETSVFKETIQKISHLIPECHITFVYLDVSGKRNEGIYITELTEDNVLIKLSFNEQLKLFHCMESEITICINMYYFHNFLAMNNDDDTIILSMNYDNRGELNISTEDVTSIIKLIERNKSVVEIPQTMFQNRITMEWSVFYRICNKLRNISSLVQISTKNNEVIFRSGNEKGPQMVYRYKDETFTAAGPLEFGVYQLRPLLNLGKCGRIGDKIEIYLKSDCPLTFVINLGTISKMYLMVPPVS